MRSLSSAQRRALDDTVRRLDAAGARILVEAPGEPRRAVGKAPPLARAVFNEASAVEPLVRGDHLKLAEAYLDGRIDLEGRLAEALKITEVMALEASRLDELRFAVSLLLRDRRRWSRESIAFHYDRPAEFFLPWFDRWRSYAHGLYETPEDSIADAMERKMQRAIDALGLEPGMRVLDAGGGWGGFVEYAGRRGIRVEAITISREQHAFLGQLIREHDLPCSVELVDFFDYRPDGRFDGAVFMGSLEHLIDYRRVAHFLRDHLAPGARAWADFCAARESHVVGGFMRKHLWPGTATYVNVPHLVREWILGGFNVHELQDDTFSYACTVRDWARRLEEIRAEHARKWGEPAVRAFLLFLWGSWHFLTTNRTQGYHLVAGLAPRPLGSGSGGLES